MFQFFLSGEALRRDSLGGEGGGGELGAFGNDQFAASEDFQLAEDFGSDGELAERENAGDFAGVTEAFGFESLDGEGGAEGGRKADDSDEEEREGDKDLCTE